MSDFILIFVPKKAKMKFKSTIILIGLTVLLMTACGERTPFRRKVKAEVPAMDFHSIKLPMEYLSAYQEKPALKNDWDTVLSKME